MQKAAKTRMSSKVKHLRIQVILLISLFYLAGCKMSSFKKIFRLLSNFKALSSYYYEKPSTVSFLVGVIT